jgi:hypothetical protein
MGLYSTPGPIWEATYPALVTFRNARFRATEHIILNNEPNVTDELERYIVLVFAT